MTSTIRLHATGLVLSAAMLLGSCGGVPATDPTQPPAPAGQNVTVNNIVAWTRFICKFEPTIATVVNLIAAANPITATADMIAQAVCGAVTQSSRRLRGTYPMVGNVPIEGHFISSARYRRR